MSAGCHQLIREQRATLASAWQDILELVISPTTDAVPSSTAGGVLPARPTDRLSEVQGRVLDAFPRSRVIDQHQLLIESGVGTLELLAALGTLEVLGLVTRTDSGWRLVRG